MKYWVESLKLKVSDSVSEADAGEEPIRLADRGAAGAATIIPATSRAVRRLNVERFVRISVVLFRVIAGRLPALVSMVKNAGSPHH